MERQKKAKIFNTGKIAMLGVLTALSLVAFLIENLFPPILIPGAKLGLANAFSFLALIMYSPLEAFLVVIARTLLGAVFAGNVSSLLYSFTGGVVSMAVSSILLYVVYPKISLLSISVAAAVAHNLTQNAVFVLVSGSLLTFSYAPYLAMIGVGSGLMIGAAVSLIIKRLPEKAFIKISVQGN